MVAAHSLVPSYKDDCHGCDRFWVGYAIYTYTYIHTQKLQSKFCFCIYFSTANFTKKEKYLKKEIRSLAFKLLIEDPTEEDIIWGIIFLIQPICNAYLMVFSESPISPNYISSFSS